MPASGWCPLKHAAFGRRVAAWQGFWANTLRLQTGATVSGPKTQLKPLVSDSLHSSETREHTVIPWAGAGQGHSWKPELTLGEGKYPPALERLQVAEAGLL